MESSGGMREGGRGRGSWAVFDKRYGCVGV